MNSGERAFTRAKITVGTSIFEFEGTEEFVIARLKEYEDKIFKLTLDQSEWKGEAPSERPTSKTETPEEKKPKQRRGSGTAKTTNWSMVNNLLDEAGRKALKAFYNEKMPSNQNEQVAVLAIKLQELTGRDGFDGNEIHTAFQIVGKKTPGNLNAVFGNMASAGLGSQAGKKFKPNFKAGDLVKHDLPKSLRKNETP